MAYLDAKHFISHDLHFVKNIAQNELFIWRKEKRDRLNGYYDLEENALDPKYASGAFLLFEGRQWTYREGYNMVLKYGAWLKATFNITPGEVIAMDFVNSDIFIWIWFGLWSIGATPAFINYNLTGKPLCHCLKVSTSKILLLDPSLQQNITPEVQSELSSPTFRDGPQPGPVDVVIFTPEMEQEIASTKPHRQPDALRANQKVFSTAMLIYTSGTTGLPKPAAVPWNRANRGGDFVSTFLSLGPSDRFFTCMPLYHSAASMLCLLVCVRSRCACVLGRRFSPSTFWSTARATNATAIQYVGETCRYLLAQKPSKLDTQHRVRVAFGNGLRPDIWDKFRTRFGIDTIAEFYAATEGVGGMWNLSRNGLSAGAVGRSGTLLRALLGGVTTTVAFDLVNETPIRDPRTGLCRVLGPGESGEMLVRIPDPARIAESFPGYFNNPAASERKVIRDVAAKGDAYFRTGDLMRSDDEGRTFFLDRIGDTFRWKSENVATSEVGEVLGLHGAVAEANVYGVEVPGHDGRCGCAAVVLREGGVRPGAETLEGLAEHVQKNLAGYARPVFLRLTEQMENTGTNKMMKAGLRAQGADLDKVREASGGRDKLFWLRGGTYVEFTERDWEALAGGRVKL